MRQGAGLFWERLGSQVRLALLILSAIGSLGTVSAQGDEFLRFRVAVLDFDVNDISGTIPEPERLGRAMATEFETPLGQSRRFVVITRLDLEKVLEEVALGPTGILNPEQVQAFGEIAGVNIIITGNITVFSNTSYSISAKFIDVATGELVDAETLRASSPEEFFQVARQFVDRAMIRFPLQGSVFAIEGDSVYINVGIVHGLTTTDETGVIFRPREVEGRSIPLRIGTFRVKQVYNDLALIEPVLESGHLLREGDLVTIQPVAVAAPAPLETADEAANTGSSESSSDDNLPASAEERKGTVYFDVEPADARLWVDGQLLEGYSATILAGTHELRVEAAGYEPVMMEFEVGPGRIEVVSLRLVEPRAETQNLVPADPPGAGPVGRMQLTAPVGSLVVAVRQDGWSTAFDATMQATQELELPAGTYSLTLLAPPNATWRDERPTTQLLMVEVPAGGEVMVSAYGYLAVENIAGGYTVEVRLTGESGLVASATGPSLVEVPAGLYVVSVVRSGVVIGAASVMAEPWELSHVNIGAIARPSGSDSAAGPEPVAQSPAAEPQGDVQGSGESAAVAARGAGVLRLSANVDPVRFTVTGAVDMVVEGGQLAVDVTVPSGLYSVLATSPGYRDVEETLYVAEGAVEAVAMTFGGARLLPQLGVLSTIDGEELFLRVNGAQGLSGAVTAKVTGPPGWNSGRSWSRNIDTSRSYELVEGVSVIAGVYTVELFPSGQPGVSVDVTINDPLRANLVRGIRTSLLSASQVQVSWSPVSWASSYEVEVVGYERQWNVVTGSRGNTTMLVPGLQNGAYAVCVTALEWNAAEQAALDNDGETRASTACTTAQLTPFAAPPATSRTQEPPPVDPPGGGGPEEPEPVGPPP